jgi:hypothetical protein
MAIIINRVINVKYNSYLKKIELIIMQLITCKIETIKEKKQVIKNKNKNVFFGMSKYANQEPFAPLLSVIIE